MKEKYKTSNYPSRNIKLETYKEGETFVTKLYHNDKHHYIKELTHEKGELKEVTHFTIKGVLAKVEYFVNDKREGVETKYFVPKANKSIKSTKTYSDGKLHGECITYNDNDEIIKQEVFANGKLVLKCLRNDSDSSDITNILIVDKENVENLPKIEYDKLQENLENNPTWFLN